MAGAVEVVEDGRALRGGHAPAVGLLAIAVVGWGCTGRVLAEAAPHAGSVMLTCLRASLAAVVLVAALPALRSRLPASRAEWGWTAASGLLMVTWFLWALTASVPKVGPGLAIVLMSTSPFFIAVAERVVFGRRLTPVTVVGLLVGFAGVILTASAQIDASGHAGDMALGVLLAISCAVAWAAGTLIVARMIARRPETDLVGVTAGQYLVGGVVLAVLALAVDGTGGAQWSSGTLWLAVAFVGIISSAIATLAFFGSLRLLDPASATSWLFLSPVVSVLLELVLGHTPTALVLVGMLVTIAGVAIVSAAPRWAAARA